MRSLVHETAMESEMTSSPAAFSCLIIRLSSSHERAIPGATSTRSWKRSSATTMRKQAAEQFVNKRKFCKRLPYLRPPRSRARILPHPANDGARWTEEGGFARRGVNLGAEGSFSEYKDSFAEQNRSFEEQEGLFVEQQGHLGVMCIKRGVICRVGEVICGAGGDETGCQDYHENRIDDNDYDVSVDEESDEKENDSADVPTHFANEFPPTNGVKKAGSVKNAQENGFRTNGMTEHEQLYAPMPGAIALYLSIPYYCCLTIAGTFCCRSATDESVTGYRRACVLIAHLPQAHTDCRGTRQSPWHLNEGRSGIEEDLLELRRFTRFDFEEQPSLLSPFDSFQIITSDVPILLCAPVLLSGRVLNHKERRHTKTEYRPPKFSHVGIVPDNAAGQWVFSGISHFSHPCIPALIRTHLASPSSALKPSILRAAQISPLTHSSQGAIRWWLAHLSVT
ncbi:hypothetical protein PR048_005139 [Dryococelus australis]|uniref:Uncharacterized protein n=1 Tax=Dryococelus australis TaxID=614101 RepID=A0ABQ9I7C8_9NEOP|nr:hypothetical protein PR048_005139 [Dryococelus australis]